MKTFTYTNDNGNLSEGVDLLEAQKIAIGFAKFLSWYETAIGKWNEEEEEYETDYMYDNEVPEVQKTTEEMFEIYLKEIL